MSKIALFIRHKARPGKRDDVRRVWEKHLRPNIENNRAHEAYSYCYDDGDPDTICVFQQYLGRDAAQEFLKSTWYGAYVDEVSPLLAEQPEVRTSTVMWPRARRLRDWQSNAPCTGLTRRERPGKLPEPQAGASLSATMPARTSPTPPTRTGLSVSPNSTTPISTVPAAPMPVHTA